MIIHNLHIPRTRIRPTKTDPELAVNTNAVLTRPIPFQRFQPISRRNSQIRKNKGNF
jgi:hypothetical protein